MYWLNSLKEVYAWAFDLALRLKQTKGVLCETEKLCQELQAENHVLAHHLLKLQTRTEELEKHNQELDSYARMVAHDLKNPLAAIYNFTNLLLEETTLGQPLESNHLKALQFTEKAAQKTINLVNALALLAGVSSAKEKVVFSPLNMYEIVQEVVQQHFIREIKAYQAHIEMPQSFPTVRGYGPWIEEVWMNYISNGLKYGGQPPHLQLGADKINDGMIQFWVHDNGRGISPENQAQLFKPFTRLNHHTSRDGHGLGLSIVRQIVEKQGGQVGVESVVNQGSRFSFTLPIEQA
jgi:two-component system, sensor histidine kinase and response regulator